MHIAIVIYFEVFALFFPGTVDESIIIIIVLWPAEVFDVSHGDESTAPAWLVIAAFEADYNMNRDDFRFNVPIADAIPSARLVARPGPG